MRLESNTHSKEFLEESKKSDREFVELLREYQVWLDKMLTKYAHTPKARQALLEDYRIVVDRIIYELKEYKENYGETY